MRTIKFRAWDKVKEEYIDFMVNPNGVYFWEKHTGCWLGKDTKKFKDFALLQYTGFKDEDGTEIYEGDILQDTNDGYITGAVEMYDGRWVCDGNDLSDCDYCHVVAGNIYENSSLLKK